MRLEPGEGPHLVVLAPEPDRGRRIQLNRDYLVVGRGPACDVRFDDTSVSRAHAALQRRGNAIYIEDLGSTAGTLVNGAAATAGRALHAGDILTFASVTARLEPGDTAGEETITMPARPAGPAGPGNVRHIGEQHGGVINNAEQIQYINQQRENFLREVAATKTRARWLAWTGFVLFVVGFGTFAAADLSFIKGISDAIRHGSQPDPGTSPFGREIWGIPFGLVGWAVAALGMILLAVGILLHVVATSRRRRAYREFPVPAPWPGGGPARGAP